MKPFIVLYRLPLLSNAWNTIRVDAETSTEAVKMCCMEIPSAKIEDVWEVKPYEDMQKLQCRET